MAKKKKEYINVTTPFGRISFPHVSKVKERNPDIPKDQDHGVGKYATSLLIPKQNDVLEKDAGMKPLLDAVKKAHESEFGKDVDMMAHHFPIVDGVEDYNDYIKKCQASGNDPSESMANLKKYWRINSSSIKKRPPSVANPLGKPMTKEQIEEYIEQDINCWGRLKLTVAAYNLNKQARGVTFYLNGVQYKEASSEGENQIIAASAVEFEAAEGATWGSAEKTESADSEEQNELDAIL